MNITTTYRFAIVLLLTNTMSPWAYHTPLLMVIVVCDTTLLIHNEHATPLQDDAMPLILLHEYEYGSHGCIGYTPYNRQQVNGIMDSGIRDVYGAYAG